MIRYYVEIEGHEPPFKWRLKRHAPGKSPETLGPSGEETPQVPTVEQAMADATEYARDLEWKRKHRTTIREQTVLLVADDAKPEPVPDEKLQELEQALERSEQK